MDSIKDASPSVIRVFWSGVQSPSKNSKGKLQKVDHFDVRLEILEYGREKGLPIVDVQAGSYMDDHLTYMAPRKVSPVRLVFPSFAHLSHLSLVQSRRHPLLISNGLEARGRIFRLCPSRWWFHHALPHQHLRRLWSICPGSARGGRQSWGGGLRLIRGGHSRDDGSAVVRE
jgi:hypothetical protein